VHHRDTIGRHIAKYGTHEPLVTRWMAEFLRVAGRGLMIDIGANLGWHTLHAAQTAGMVVAFEPDPFNAWLLERNLVANGINNVVVETRAVGAAPGMATLYRYKTANRGRHSLAVDHGHGSRSVSVTDLDGALKGLGLAGRDVALIKIDVEGYEPAVIEGAKDTLTRSAAIILEYSPDLSRAGGLSTAGMHAQLAAANFAPFVLRARGGTSRTTVDELNAFVGSLDVIWVRAERQAALAHGMNERERDGLSLVAIAEQNKQIMTRII
jgi:FkbM family methyltransferase